MDRGPHSTGAPSQPSPGLAGVALGPALVLEQHLPPWQLQLEHGLALLGMVPSNLRAKPPFPLPVLCASYLFSETSKARRPSWAPEMHLIYCCQPQTKWPLTLAILQRGWLPWWLRGQSLCLQCGRPGFNPLEKKMATQSSILAWEIPWTEEPGGLVHRVTKSRTQLSMHMQP